MYTCYHKGAHQGGYWIPISREKIGHISKSREKFRFFPILNFSSRHPAEYFVFNCESFLKQ